MKHFSIAIDGPAGAGKSTIAKQLSRLLGFMYVDTGAMYRAMALYFLRSSADAQDEERINLLCDDINVQIEYEQGEQQVILNDENVTKLIRTEEVSKMASASSVYPKVRLKLVELQRALAKEHDVIMDGRDIGSYVLPDADLKIFLTADTHVRAKRRCDELAAKGETHNIEDIEEEIRQRDHRDSTREFAPLTRVPDAVEIDTSDMAIEEVIRSIQDIFRQRLLDSAAK